MKIILTSIGTRGDMEPLLAIGELLHKRGHQIICMMPEQFRSLAEDSRFEFATLGWDFIKMLDSPAGKTAMGGGRFTWKKLMAYKELIKVQGPINKAMVQIQRDVIEKEQPDHVVHNGKVIYPVIWSWKNKGKTTLISPVPYMHYVKDHAHVMMDKNFGAFFNKLTYKLVNYGLVKTVMSSVKSLNLKEDIKQKQIQEALFSNHAIYTISPTLFERPDYWSENLEVLGYHERDIQVNWQPTKELNTFLAKYNKIMLVTFGSMINSNPPEKTKIILDILVRNKIPAIINTASGGLVKPNGFESEYIHFVNRIPYDWILPKMYGVVHHGGSGTTHMTLKYGCASLIIPHIIDQYVWNTILSKKGAGPKGMDVSKIKTQNLETNILDLLENPSYKKRAEELAASMGKEDFEEELCASITKR